MGHEVRLASVAPASRSGRSSRVASLLKRFLPQLLFEISAAVLNLIDYVRFKRLLRLGRPAIVYKRHANYDVGVLLAARAAGVPTILEVNCAYSSPEYNRFEPLTFRRVARRFERIALQQATLILAVSTPLAEYLRMLHGGSPHLEVLPNGADPSRFSPARAVPAEIRRRLSLGSGTVVGWAGIFRPWHRLDLLLDAVATIPEVTLLVIGDGPEERRLRLRAGEPDLQGRVRFAGRIPHDEMIHYIAAMDVAVVAGDDTQHASPMKLLEYMAMERAVVAPRQRNIEDIVRDEVTGLLFAPGDAAHLAQVLHRLVQDENLRERLGSAARRNVLLERNWTNNAARAIAALAAARPLGPT